MECTRFKLGTGVASSGWLEHLIPWLKRWAAPQLMLLSEIFLTCGRVLVSLGSGDPVKSHFSDQGGPKSLFKAAELGSDLLHDSPSVLKLIHPRCCCHFQVTFVLQLGQKEDVISCCSPSVKRFYPSSIRSERSKYYNS